MNSKFWNNLPESQAGFQKNRSTMDHIFTLFDVGRKLMNSNQKLYCAFIDLNKAFDSIYRKEIWECLRRKNCNSTILKVIRSLYNRSSIQFRVNGHLSDSFETRRGVQQGCLLSPVLFNFVLEGAMEKFESLFARLDGTLWVNNRQLLHLDYADDIVIFSHTTMALQQLLRNLEEAMKPVGLTINVEKTALMEISKAPKNVGELERVKLGDQCLTWVRETKYLGISG